MGTRRIVTTFGAALFTACTAGGAQPGEDGFKPPPLGTWESVKSGHPEGATNPPTPYLLVSPDGASCWKAFGGGMTGPTPETSNRVLKVGEEPHGTAIVCPDFAKEVLAKPACPEAEPQTGEACATLEASCPYPSCGVDDGATAICTPAGWRVERVTCNPPPPMPDPIPEVLEKPINKNPPPPPR
jgi:hypothetical protein